MKPDLELPLRPSALAHLLLASTELSPRQRARDQQADLTGMALKRHVLEKLAILDPEPEQLEATLMRLVDELGPPHGPTRAIAGGILEEWQAAQSCPEWIAQLLGEALREPGDANRGQR